MNVSIDLQDTSSNDNGHESCYVIIFDNSVVSFLYIDYDKINHYFDSNLVSDHKIFTYNCLSFNNYNN